MKIFVLCQGRETPGEGRIYLNILPSHGVSRTRAVGKKTITQRFRYKKAPPVPKRERGLAVVPARDWTGLSLETLYFAILFLMAAYMPKRRPLRRMKPAASLWS